MESSAGSSFGCGTEMACFSHLRVRPSPEICVCVDPLVPYALGSCRGRRPYADIEPSGATVLAPSTCARLFESTPILVVVRQRLGGQQVCSCARDIAHAA